MCIRDRIEDGGAVLRAAVVALAVCRGRVVDLEEQRQDIAVARLRRVELDLDGFRMPALTGLQVLIGRVGDRAAGIANAGCGDARVPADQVLHAPEAASGEEGGFLFRAHNSAPFAHSIAPRTPVSYTHLRAHETVLDLVCRLLLEKKKKKQK
eukprot:TRINITY_DN624_c0_g1_i2.p1 TRINITY_DN624_c0_g1~~TRINITY_DN624_c0_g1_i2.p1  ORF type:complete len:166 (+),score=45.87 TRINITY_DN624_c0_g1_i2:42-500(+)